MVKTGRNQCSENQTIEEGSDESELCNCGAKPYQEISDIRPDNRKDNTGNNRRDNRDNRDKVSAAEEGKCSGQFDVLIPVMQNRYNPADYDTAEHAGIHGIGNSEYRCHKTGGLGKLFRIQNRLTVLAIA